MYYYYGMECDCTYYSGAIISCTCKIFIGFRGGYCCDYRCELFKIQRPVLYSSGNTYNVKMFITGYGQKILPILSSVIELLGKVIFTFAVIPHMGYNGVIICEPVVWCAMAVYLVMAYIKAVPKSCPEA